MGVITRCVLPRPGYFTRYAVKTPRRGSTHRGMSPVEFLARWAILLRRTYGVDALRSPRCAAKMRVLAMITEPSSIARFLTALGEPKDVPARSPNRGPPYCKSTVLRRKALGDAA
jgi:hypothetical protein